jgi:hypothetical protein
MKDLFDFLLAPVRRVPWSVATLFGAVLVLIMVVSHMVAPHVFVWQVGVAACFAPGLVGASRGREFDQGILAAFAAIVIAFVIGAGVLIATNSMNALVPLPAMILLGLPIGTVGAGVGTWLSHRRSIA